MCAAHPGKWGPLSTATDHPAGSHLPSPSFCELRELYVRTDERRQFPRLPLSLRVHIRRVGGQIAREPLQVSTADISCGGISFVIDRKLEPGTPLDLEIVMANQPMGGPSMRMLTRAHVVRQSPARRLGWTGVAAVFDDITFDRDPSPDRAGN